MKREHAVTIVLALFAIWIASAGADSPKFGDIPNPNGMNYGWDAANNTVRAIAVDADGNLQAEATNASTTPVNAILRDGSTGAQIGTTTNPLAVGGTVAVSNFPTASGAVSNPTNALPAMIAVSDGTNVARVLAPVSLVDGVNGNNMLPGCNYVWNGASWDRMVGSAASGLKVNGDVTVTNPGASGVSTDPVYIANEKDYSFVNTAFAVYQVELATNSVTALSAICSFTPPCEILFYNNADMYWGTPAQASATIQTGHKKVADSEWSIKPKLNTFDMNFIAAPTAKASMTVTVFPLVTAP